MKNTIDLKGVMIAIGGMIFMLLPLGLLFGSLSGLSNWIHLVGFVAIAYGLFSLMRHNPLFGTGSMAALLSAVTLLLTCILFHGGAILEVLPTALYCFVLFFMCTGFSRLADQLGDHHFSHAFLHHMRNDIAVTVLEIVTHILFHGIFHLDHTLSTIISLVVMALVIFVEAVLMLEMYRFYKKYHGFRINGAM